MSNLSEIYNKLKSGDESIDDIIPKYTPSDDVYDDEASDGTSIGSGIASLPDTIKGPMAYRSHMHKIANDARDTFHQKVLIDIYAKILPVDKEYIQMNTQIPGDDISSMLAHKFGADSGAEGATMYLKSAFEKTKAPLVEFVLYNGDMLYNRIMEDAEETISDQVADGNDNYEIQDTEDQTDAINSQLIDVNKDMEYEEFIDALKNKTVDKIVNDVSAVIKDERDKKAMTFNPKALGESSQTIIESSMNYMNGIVPEMDPEEKMCYAIREATLSQFDILFKQPEFIFASKNAQFGNGMLMNENVFKNIGDGIKNGVTKIGDGIKKGVENVKGGFQKFGNKFKFNSSDEDIAAVDSTVSKDVKSVDISKDKDKKDKAPESAKK